MQNNLSNIGSKLVACKCKVCKSKRKSKNIKRAFQKAVRQSDKKMNFKIVNYCRM